MKQPRPAKRRHLVLDLSCRRRGVEPHGFRFECHLPEAEALAKYETMVDELTRLLNSHGFLTAYKMDPPDAK